MPSPARISRAEEGEEPVRHKAEEHSEKRGEGAGEERPTYTFCLFVNGEDRRGAGPVEQAEEHEAERRFTAPPR